MSPFVAVTIMIFLSPNLPGLLEELPFGVPLIRVHGALTITGIGGGSLIIHRCLITNYFGAFPNVFLDITESYMTRHFLYFDGVHDALAINVEALSLISHLLQQLGPNTCSILFKSSEIIIRKSIWNQRTIFYLKGVRL